MVDPATTKLTSSPEDNLVAAVTEAVVSDPEVWRNNLFGLDMPADILSIVYAGTVALGGIMGYATKGSLPSLIAGLTFGAILGVGAWITSVNPRNYELILGTSAVLAGLMGYRFYNSGKFMPAGLVFTLSSLMVIRFALRFITNKNFI